MERTLLFLIAQVICFSICIRSAEKGIEVDLIIFQKQTANHAQVDTALNKELYFNRSELEAAQSDECKCKNGKCMRACDVEKTTPCEDQRMVCVCNPEFGKTKDFECEYCDCGQGFNCTFTRNYFSGKWDKSCKCPDGYYNDYYAHKCTAKCNEERPCQNGGTCRYNFECQCPWGTRGDLCEEIIECNSKCKNRLEVDCVLDSYERVVYCDCKNSSLYYDENADICKPCDCENGYCDYKFEYFGGRVLKCYCHSGYLKFNGRCKRCDCGFGSEGRCRFDDYGEKICSCFDGFYERDGQCHSCDCHGWNDTETNCVVTGNMKRCFCENGFQDVLGHCEDINECEIDNACHPSATCVNTFGRFFCDCPEGYKGADGRQVEPTEVCEDIDECEESITCWTYDDTKCVNLLGSYKCECLPGYEPISNLDEPQRTRCVKASKNVGPAFIVLCTTIILLALSYFVHLRVKKRAANSN